MSHCDITVMFIIFCVGENFKLTLTNSQRLRALEDDLRTARVRSDDKAQEASDSRELYVREQGVSSGLYDLCIPIFDIYLNPNDSSTNRFLSFTLFLSLISFCLFQHFLSFFFCVFFLVITILTSFHV